MSSVNITGFDDYKDRLTDRQLQVLDFIRQAVRQAGYPPTVRDIASHLNIISLNAVRRHLQALEKKGVISVEPGKSRGIRVRDDFYGEPPVITPEECRIPLVGFVAAGPMTTAQEDVEATFAIDPEIWGNPEDLFLLRVRGDSMFPRLEEGDMVAVRRQSHATPGDLIVALSEDEATVKQLKIKDGKYFLHPLNPAYEDIPAGEGFQINGKVVGLIRKI